MTKRLGVVDLVELASAAGAARSGWHRVGTGPWYGTVVDKDGVEWELEQLSSTWRATSSTSAVSSARTIELLLKEIC
jgi:hypothetical protein